DHVFDQQAALSQGTTQALEILVPAAGGRDELEAVEHVVEDEVIAGAGRPQELFGGYAVEGDAGERRPVQAEEPSADRLQVRLRVHCVDPGVRVIEGEALGGSEGAGSQHQGPADGESRQVAEPVQPEVVKG